MMMTLGKAELGKDGSLSSFQAGRASLSLLLALLCCTFCTAIPYPGTKEQELRKIPDSTSSNMNVYLVRTKRFEDQRGSSSGYMYQTSGHDGPTSYVHFKTSYQPLRAKTVEENKPEEKTQQVYVIPENLPSITKHLSKKEIDDRDKYAAEVFQQYNGPTHMETVEEDDDNEDEEDDNQNYEENEEYEEEPLVVNEEKGSSYQDSSQSKHGDEGSSGYNTNENFAKGQSGKHSKENSAGSHSSNSGNKASSHEDSGHYASDHSAGGGEKGGSHSQSESHKKGSKTTGYHKVYRKDEYKKDHTFYDEKDVKGHFDTYGSGHKEHSGEEGGFRKGGKHASGHSQQEAAAKGQYDKGRYDHHDAGYKAQNGREKFHKNGENYKSADGKHSYREQAFKE